MNKNTQKPVVTPDNQPQNQDAQQIFGFNHPLSNGEEIPVIVHPQAANNVDLKDMSPKISTPFGDMSMQEVLAFYNQIDKVVNHNVVENTFEIVRKATFKGEQKFKKEGESLIPVFDNGEPVYYPDSFFAVVNASGEDKYIRVSSSADYEMIDEGMRYLFKGHMDWVSDKNKQKQWTAVYTSVSSAL